MAAEAEYWSFPTNPEEFDQDERISYSRLDNKHIAVQDDGTEYEFDAGLKRWIPMIDEALIEEQQRGYMMPDADADDDRRGRKRKMDHSNDREDNNFNNKDRPSKPAKRQGKPAQPKQNTAVYVTGLPSDATADEVAELFSRKCGVIAEEIDSGRPRIKMYTDADGSFKGDALIVFFKPQSVEMAIMLLDDTEFRFPPAGSSSTTKMRVQAADMSYKKTKYDGDKTNTANNNKPGEGGISSNNNNRASAAENLRSNQDKAKIIRKTQKLSAKLADWSDDDEPSALNPNPSSTTTTGTAAASAKWDRLVILRHMFTLDELQEDATALLDIKEDIRDECSKLGAVTNVVLYDEEEEGIVSVKFATREAAEACLRLMHGRAFAGRIVEAFFATGREKFRRSRGEVAGHGGDGDDDHDER